jgi:hypothetical protein
MAVLTARRLWRANCDVERVRALLVGVLVLLPRLALGQETPRQPLQELFFTEVVYPQEQREVQLTLGLRVDRSRSDLSMLMPLAIEYGLTDRWQIEAGWDGYTQAARSAPITHLRTARVSLGTKYSLMNIAHSRMHAAFGVDAEFPKVDAFAKPEGEAGMEVEPFVALAGDLNARLTLFGSVGASLEPREVRDLATRGQRPDDRGSISFGGLLALQRVTLAAEYTNRSDELPWRLDGAPLVTPSIAVHPGHQWELATGVPIAVRRGQRQPGFAMNIVREF